MAQFFEVASLVPEMPTYINRDIVACISVEAETDVDLIDRFAYSVEYSYGTEGFDLISHHKTLEEAKAEARKIAEGRTCDKISVDNRVIEPVTEPK